VLVLEDKDKVRIKHVLLTLLDHIDQSSGIEMLEDVKTGEKPSEPEVESLAQSIDLINGTNGRDEEIKEFGFPYKLKDPVVEESK